MPAAGLFHRVDVPVCAYAYQLIALGAQLIEVDIRLHLGLSQDYCSHVATRMRAPARLVTRGG
jgi:hypothetical protein